MTLSAFGTAWAILNKFLQGEFKSYDINGYICTILNEKNFSKIQQKIDEARCRFFESILIYSNNLKDWNNEKSDAKDKVTQFVEVSIPHIAQTKIEKEVKDYSSTEIKNRVQIDAAALAAIITQQVTASKIDTAYAAQEKVGAAINYLSSNTKHAEGNKADLATNCSTPVVKKMEAAASQIEDNDERIANSKDGESASSPLYQFRKINS